MLRFRCLLLAVLALPTWSCLAMPESTVVSGETLMQCDASKVQWALGEMADDALAERARSAAGARSVRVIAHGMMVTQEYREDRLNLDLDEHGRVRAVRCG